MSGKIKILLLFLMCGCTAVQIPDPYRFRATELKTQPYGCWMIVTLGFLPGHPARETLGGELLFLNDTITKLLVADGEVASIPTQAIFQAELLTHRNQSGSYLGLMLPLIIPSLVGTLKHGGEYAGYFLLTAVPVTAVGSFFTLMEGQNADNLLKYPEKNVLSQFSRFARFPVNWPENVDPGKLTLKR